MDKQQITIELNKNLFVKNPQSSALGKKIISNSILLIDKYGFEAFTFKKLAKEISSTEASIYRYFENKHLLLIYLMNWYWKWVTYLIQQNSAQINNPKEKLKMIVHSFVHASLENPSIDFIREDKLQSIVITEGVKAYHSKDVDSENLKGFFAAYKALVNLVSDVIIENNPSFRYPHALATNLLEMANNHIYFSRHLPRLTDISIEENDVKEVEEMLNYFVVKLLS